MMMAILTTIRPKAKKLSIVIPCREREAPYNTYSLESKALVSRHAGPAFSWVGARGFTGPSFRMAFVLPALPEEIKLVSEGVDALSIRSQVRSTRQGRRRG